MQLEQMLKEYLEDCSDERQFQFQIHCEHCGSIWKSTPILFSYGDVVPQTEEKRVIFQALYQREKESAYSSAIKEAREVFSRCPICKRLICDQCFLLCDEIEMCKDCAARLKETGVPVA